METLKIILNSLKYLKSINIWCGRKLLSEKEALDTFVKYSQNIYELILFHKFGSTQIELLPEELESFFISWANRKPQKLLTFTVDDYIYKECLGNEGNEYKNIIKKCIKLGVIKKFKVIHVYGKVLEEFN